MDLFKLHLFLFHFFYITRVIYAVFAKESTFWFIRGAKAVPTRPPGHRGGARSLLYTWMG